MSTPILACGCRWRSRSGNAILEFALSFVLIFPLLAGSFQFGYSFYLYNRMQTAVEGGARYASLRTYDSLTATPSQAYLNAVRNQVVYGNPNGGASPVLPGLTPGRVAVTMTFVSGAPRSVTVSVVNYQLNAVFQTLTFNNKPQVTMPYVGRWDAVP
jgi:Flp pilus assembly protein TadG